MKQRSFAIALVSPKAQRQIEQGHPWVYDTEIRSIEGAYKNGDLVDIAGEKGTYLGTGFVSERSKIRIRMVSRNANDRFDEAFWARRLRYAWEYRKTVLEEADLSCCRIIFGEADQFPGLTVDRFGDVLVAQTLSLGMERVKPLLFPLLRGLLEQDGQRIRGVYERNDVPIRELEGLTQGRGWFGGDGGGTKTQIAENGITYEVDFENGQKTGFFLDQKYNRRAVARLAKGRRVLDCFTHTGSFALNAAHGGAAYVRAVDVSEAAVTLARDNAVRNGLDGVIECQAANVFDLLHSLPGQPYDYIILDPPAFTKSHQTVDAALRGYKDINLRAMKLLPRGGYLATCSCSHFMTPELFTKTIREAAKGAHRRLRQVEYRTQAADHPILWAADESYYLKFYLFQVCGEL